MISLGRFIQFHQNWLKTLTFKRRIIIELGPAIKRTRLRKIFTCLHVTMWLTNSCYQQHRIKRNYNDVVLWTPVKAGGNIKQTQNKHKTQTKPRRYDKTVRFVGIKCLSSCQPFRLLTSEIDSKGSIKDKRGTSVLSRLAYLFSQAINRCRKVIYFIKFFYCI